MPGLFSFLYEHCLDMDTIDASNLNRQFLFRSVYLKHKRAHIVQIHPRIQTSSDVVTWDACIILYSPLVCQTHVLCLLFFSLLPFFFVHYIATILQCTEY